MSKNIHIHLARPSFAAKTADKAPCGCKGTKDSSDPKENDYAHFGDDTIIRKAMQGDPKAKAEARRRGIDKVRDRATMNQMDSARKDIERMCAKINNYVSEEQGVSAAAEFGKIAQIAQQMMRV